MRADPGRRADSEGETMKRTMLEEPIDAAKLEEILAEIARQILDHGIGSVGSFGQWGCSSVCVEVCPVRRDIALVAEVCHKLGARLKVILETALLTDPEKVKACELAQLAGADFVKTSTGFSKGGATAADVALMRKTVGPTMGVKAAGGI